MNVGTLVRVVYGAHFTEIIELHFPYLGAQLIVYEVICLPTKKTN